MLTSPRSPRAQKSGGIVRKEALLPHKARDGDALFRADQEATRRRDVARSFTLYTKKNVTKISKSRWGSLRPGSGIPPAGLIKEAGPQEYMPCLGIDLGTTNSCVAAWNGKSATVLRSFQYSASLIPSTVAYTKNDILVGHAASKQWGQNPVETIYSSKRWIGKEYDQSAAEMAKKYPYRVKRHPNGYCGFAIKGKAEPVQPEQMAAKILEHVKQFASSDHLRRDVRDAVITVPAYFNDVQRAMTKKAGVLAGLNVLMILNEPTAAAIACGVHSAKSNENLWQRKNVLVFDLGGGTLDVTVMFMDAKRFEVLSTGGDRHLGGDDFDMALFDHFRKDMLKKLPTLPKDSSGQVQLTPCEHVELLVRCREVKEALAEASNQTFEIEIAKQVYKGQLTRARMDMLTSKLITQAVNVMSAVLQESGLHRGSIDDVVLVGGSTKMKKVQDVIEKFFAGFKAFMVKVPNPDQIVAEGAAIKAAVMLESDESSSVPPPTLPLISDVVPQTVGIALPNDQYHIVIHRNTPVPSSQRLELFFMYKTTSDMQSAVQFSIFQGENSLASENFHLGTCVLEGLPPRPAGDIDICVKFLYDQLGYLEVHAWVHGEGHINTMLRMTDNAYEAIDKKVAFPADSLVGKEPLSVHIGNDFFVSSMEVPKDLEDLKMESDRQRAADQHRNQKKKEKREARDREKAERQNDLARHVQRASSIVPGSSRQLSSRSNVSGVSTQRHSISSRREKRDG
eukprot:TRINITY_DN6631_c0_g1_i1.p1 TRINITY_DN6631_c0_g1~~TRINITY_DN6631_c0_g1_i1.p1  ORF type:complete len:751 (+),score=142.22 TRINITY_DN6631_c0_g1_i1:45-2255(+)